MPEAKVAESKKKIVKEFEDLIMEYPIVGAVNMENLPTKQLQNLRAQLRETVVLRMTKRRLMRIAIEDVKDKKKGIEQIEPYLKGMPALLFTRENPFKLFKKLQKNKSKAPAKAGQVAPNDIVVPAGPTSFAPGPIISELAGVGIKTGVEGGKVAVKEDTIVAKEGETITPELAGILTRLGIEPMEIGLEVVATLEDGTIYTKDILAVDETEYINNITQAASWAFNLAVEANYPTKDTVTLMITRASRDSKAVALEGAIATKDLIDELLGRAENQAASLKNECRYEEKIAAKEEKQEEPAESES